MIAIDTSSFVAFLAAERGEDVDVITYLLRGEEVVLPPVVVSELLSAPKLPSDAEAVIRFVPRLEIEVGYWERAGRLRAAMISKGWNVALADTLIAQSCIDHDVQLVTRDKGFKAFARHAELRLL